MTEPNSSEQFPPPGPIPPGSPIPPGGAGGGVPRRRRLLIGGVAGGVVVLALLGLGIANLTGAFDAPAPSRSDPVATATVFIQRYATHDPAVCELVTEKLAKAFHRDGRCTGTTTGTTPRIDVRVSHTCGNRHSFDAEVNPPGEIGQRWVSLGLEQSADQQWSVRSVLPISDRNVISDTPCAKPSSEYWGG